MKIIETIEGSTENTVVYEDGTGKRITVTRPKIVSVKQIVAEIQASGESPAKPSIKPEEQKVFPTEESAPPENIPDKAPNSSPNAGNASRDINTPKPEQALKTRKNENPRKG